MIDTFRGTLRVRKWPKKRGRPKSERQRWWNEWFKQANLLAKYADPLTQATAIELTKGSGLYPRDIILKAMRGRLYWFSTPDGWKWYPMAAIGDISETLDVLAQTVGSVLVRATDRWRPPAPGSIGDVLTYKGDEAPAEWVAPSGGGFSFAGALVSKLSNQSIGNGVLTIIAWDTEQYDTDGLHDNAVNPSRMTVPADWSRVRLYAGISWQSNSVGDRLLRFQLNGIGFPGMAYSRMQAVGTSDNAIASPTIVVVPGDYFEVQVYQASGAAKNVIAATGATYFAMERVT